MKRSSMSACFPIHPGRTTEIYSLFYLFSSWNPIFQAYRKMEKFQRFADKNAFLRVLKWVWHFIEFWPGRDVITKVH